MLKFTKKVEYALIALSHMCNKSDGETSSVSEISKGYMIPQEILAKTLQYVAHQGMITSVLGPNGGYQLCDNVKNMDLMQIIETLEGPIGLVDCSINVDCQQLDKCNVQKPLRAINDKIKNTLSEIKFKDLIY
tara:strand:+ start:2376 stop:2774 length:399 start_codon:yes stop_codon:yes gene_type:complete